VEHLSPFAAWESFYVIVGSSAAALTGLQFVVTVLSAEMRGGLRSEHVTSAFSTPTIVHFCAVLLNAAILTAPWRRLTSAAVTIGLFGALGLIYTLLVLRHARRQTDYVPVLEDWIWHLVLPLVTYGAFLGSALWLPGAPAPSLFVVGGASVLLLFVGIHNAWDSVVYIAERLRKQGADEKARAG
jgi:hypothetical protein